jgi:SAM-dependent methyltransferase
MKRFFPGAGTYLEAGCGTGFFLKTIESTFPALAVHGTDLFVEGLAATQRRTKHARLFQCDLGAIPFEAEFDVLGAYDVLEHIRDDTAVLRQFHLALKPGGGVILTVPQHPFLWSWVDDSWCHCRRYRVGELAAKVREAGFSVVCSTSFVSLLFPTMAISRFAQIIRPPKVQRIDLDLKISPVLNRIFEWVLDFERSLTSLGVRFCFGGSSVVVAIKQ